ncbi:MAG: hypothetical protein F3742_06260 [Nitrospinae bacterium]|nr:hypothetical protein [Nitrospinota bacterium]MZH14355.1 hypothetical protein [Nitrospinota bacterium]
MTFFYHILSLLFAVAIVPLFTLFSISSKYKFKFLKHHFGFAPGRKKEGTKTVWLYALSLGEVKAAAPVLKNIHEKNPNLKIVVSVTTDSGYEGALEHLKVAENIFFHPLDCLPFTWLAVSRIQPDLYLVVDTGFWPGLIDQLHHKKIPMLVLNGRISDASAKNYLKAGSLFQVMFQQFDRLCMQNKNDQQALIALGVNPEKIELAGDPKFDELQPMNHDDKIRLRKIFKLEESTPLWIAGSTHAGEEEIVLEAHLRLKKMHPDLVLILAPRRIERVGDISSLLEKKNIPFCRRSSMEGSLPKSVILLDTMGELAGIYSLCKVALIGRSLVAPGGGHSLIEPLANGAAVLHGPYIGNIGRVADEARKQGLAFTVNKAEDICEKVHSFLEQKEQDQGPGSKAKAFFEEQKGAAEKMAGIALETLN